MTRLCSGRNGETPALVCAERVALLDRHCDLRVLLIRAAPVPRPPTALVTRQLERALWLVAPVLIAGLAHVAVIILDVAPALARPIDAGRRWHGRELVGRNKTWRGFVVMPLGAALTVSLQDAIAQRAPRLGRLGRIRPGAPPAWIVGAVCGLAYVVAELPNSFAKRRLGIPPGGRTSAVQYAIDQFDSVIGCVIPVRAFYETRTSDAVAAGVMGGLFHVLVERGMHALVQRG